MTTKLLLLTIALLASGSAAHAADKFKLPGGMIGDWCTDENAPLDWFFQKGEWAFVKGECPKNVLTVKPDGAFNTKEVSCRVTTHRTQVLHSPSSKYYTPRKDINDSGFTNLKYIFSYRCNNDQKKTVSMYLEKGYLIFDLL
jgi:hypothetical protein